MISQKYNKDIERQTTSMKIKKFNTQLTQKFQTKGKAQWIDCFGKKGAKHVKNQNLDDMLRKQKMQKLQ